MYTYMHMRPLPTFHDILWNSHMAWAGHVIRILKQDYTVKKIGHGLEHVRTNLRFFWFEFECLF